MPLYISLRLLLTAVPEIREGVQETRGRVRWFELGCKGSELRATGEGAVYNLLGHLLAYEVNFLPSAVLSPRC